MWSVPVKFIITLAPAILVGAAGAVYLAETAEFLLAPGIRATLSYPTPAGRVTAKLGSYNYNPRLGSLEAKNVEVYNPSGSLLASCDEVFVRQVGLAGVRPVVTLKRPLVNLERRANGKLDIQDLVAPSSGPPSTTPFQVEILNGTLRLRDLASRDKRTTRVTIPRLTASGRGEDLLVKGDVVVDNLISASIQVAKDNKDLSFHVRANDAKVDRVLAWIRNTRERTLLKPLDPLTLGPALADIRLAGIVKNSKLTSLHGYTRARGTQTRFQKYQLDSWSYEGSFTDKGLNGELIARQRGASAKYLGALYVTPKGIGLDGSLEAEGISDGLVAGYLPKGGIKGLSFSGVKVESYGVLQPGSPMGAEVLITAKSVTYQKQTLSPVELVVSQDTDRTSFKIRKAAYANRPIQGYLTWMTKTGAITGAFKSESVPISVLPIDGIAGMAKGDLSIYAQVSGQLTNPAVKLRSVANPQIKVAKNWVGLGRFEGVGIYADGGIQIERADLQGPEGILTFRGGISKDQVLRGTLAGRGIRSDRLANGALLGSFDLEGTVSGPLNKPQFVGRVEGYQVGNKTVKLPLVTSDVRVSRTGLMASNIQMIKGVGSLTGRVSATFATKKINGIAQIDGLQLDDLTDSSILGGISANRVILGGTFESPTLTADVLGENIVASDLKIQSLATTVKYDRGTVSADDLKATLGGGTVTGKATYVLDRERADISAEFKDIGVRDTVAQFVPKVALAGSVSGKVSAILRRNKLDDLKASGVVDDLKLNRALAGSGSWSVSREDAVWKANIDLGQLERYIQINNLKFSEQSRLIEGSVDVGNVPIKELLLASQFARASDEDIDDQTEKIGGVLSLGAKIGGTLEEPTVEAKVANISNLSYSGQALGDLNVQAGYEKGRVNLRSLTLEGRRLAGFASGFVDIAETGMVSLEGKIGSLDLALFADYVPAFQQAQTKVKDFTFYVSGLARKPNVSASLECAVNLTPPLKVGQNADGSVTAVSTFAPTPGLGLASEPINISVYRLEFNPTEGDKAELTFDGKLGYSVFQGDFNGRLPFDLKDGLDKTAPLEARIKLNPQSLDRLIELAPTISSEKAASQIKTYDPEAGPKDQDWVRISGTAQNLKVSGGIVASATTLKVIDPDNKKPPVTTFLKDVNVSLLCKDNRLSLSAEAKSSQSAASTTPNLAFQASVDVSDLLSIDSKKMAFLERPIQQGSLRATNLRFRQQGFKLGTEAQPDAFIDAELSTVDPQFAAYQPIKIGGTLAKPEIVGQIRVDTADGILPTLGESGETDKAPAVDPRFDVKIKIGSPFSQSDAKLARIRASTSDLFFTGSTQIAGSLSNPDVKTDLVVERGTLRLPGGLVRIDQGGTIKLEYQAGKTSQTKVAELQANMVGRTRLTSLRNGTIPERYEIILAIRGNILEPGGLQLDATSDPPDLTRDRIFAMLGQTDLLQGLFGAGRDNLQRDLQNAVASYALPTLLSGVTDSLARGLGFEYVNLDYNAVEQASVSFARGFGRGLFVLGRTQISEPLTGQPRIFDFRLAYRPRRGTDFVRALSFSLGTDQERPYRISIDYTTRFGSQFFPYQRIILGRPK